MKTSLGEFVHGMSVAAGLLLTSAAQVSGPPGQVGCGHTGPACSNGKSAITVLPGSSGNQDKVDFEHAVPMPLPSVTISPTQPTPEEAPARDAHGPQGAVPGARQVAASGRRRS